MSTLKERRLAFLQNMIDYYSEDTSRRSVNDASYSMYDVICYYRDSDGIRKCSIGRFISDNKYISDIEGCPANSNIVFNRINSDIQELGREFLRRVQMIHDDNKSWNKEGLTERGNTEVNLLKNRIDKLEDSDDFL